MLGGNPGNPRRKTGFACSCRLGRPSAPAAFGCRKSDRLVRPYGAGFTLVELMVTLSVAAIFAGLAVPAMEQSLQRRQIEGAAREVFGNLMMVRSQAIEKNRNSYISFSGSGTH